MTWLTSAYLYFNNGAEQIFQVLPAFPGRHILNNQPVLGPLSRTVFRPILFIKVAAVITAVASSSAAINASAAPLSTTSLVIVKVFLPGNSLDKFNNDSPIT